ncbi:Probable glycolate oxidase iron-sulfur subunit [Geodia barretti]|uniref:Probable glycolate oxidase iron-sulfur subunit n=1 Tax=Geodia barretti TaxID=519541 RepID=A0AA35W8F1_GEOBA|nr:Probable glycolate oxidase iron-sulfur subunit [Geodia barretti]
MVQQDISSHSHTAEFEEPLNSEPGFLGVDSPAEADLYRCVHCGLCLSSCPTYSTLHLETESPRGRIALMRAVHEGRVGISDRIVSHWEMCLQCRACEAVCPSGVPYGRIMEYSRAQTLAQDKQGSALKRVDRFFLRAALPHPKRLRFGARLLQLYQRTGLRKLVRASGLLKLLPETLAQMEAQLPDLDGPFFGPTDQLYPAQPRQGSEGANSQAAPTVALLSGCVMPLMQGETMQASVRVLTRNGCNVAVPLGQVCCGALNIHAGDLETARRLARRNIDVFLASGADRPGYRIITASAGCGSNMKEYSELLKHDHQYAEPARRFAELTVDITEFLAELPLDPPQGRIDRRVTYQDPCHLVHAQRITRQPRDVLKAVPGLELVEMEASTMCCGGAGFYSMVQPDLSGRILATKIGNIEATNAEQVVTANPGCMMQIEQGLGSANCPAAGQKVVHVVDLLDEAYRSEGD